MKSAQNYLVFIKSKRKFGICSYECDSKSLVTYFSGKGETGRSFDIFWRINIIRIIKLPRIFVKWFCKLRRDY